jgi:hypothetical protein
MYGSNHISPVTPQARLAVVTAAVPGVVLHLVPGVEVEALARGCMYLAHLPFLIGPVVRMDILRPLRVHAFQVFLKNEAATKTAVVCVLCFKFAR